MKAIDLNEYWRKACYFKIGNTYVNYCRSLKPIFEITKTSISVLFWSFCWANQTRYKVRYNNQLKYNNKCN